MIYLSLNSDELFGKYRLICRKIQNNYPIDPSLFDNFLFTGLYRICRFRSETPISRQQILAEQIYHVIEPRPYYQNCSFNYSVVTVMARRICLCKGCIQSPFRYITYL